MKADQVKVLVRIQLQKFLKMSEDGRIVTKYAAPHIMPQPFNSLVMYTFSSDEAVTFYKNKRCVN